MVWLFHGFNANFDDIRNCVDKGTSEIGANTLYHSSIFRLSLYIIIHYISKGNFIDRCKTAKIFKAFNVELESSKISNLLNDRTLLRPNTYVMVNISTE